MTILQNLNSKKLLAFVLLVLINGLNDTLGLGLSHDAIVNITEGGGVYIIVQGAIDLVRAYMIKHTFANMGQANTTPPVDNSGADKSH